MAEIKESEADDEPAVAFRREVIELPSSSPMHNEHRPGTLVGMKPGELKYTISREVDWLLIVQFTIYDSSRPSEPSQIVDARCVLYERGEGEIVVETLTTIEKLTENFSPLRGECNQYYC